VKSVSGTNIVRLKEGWVRGNRHGAERISGLRRDSRAAPPVGDEGADILPDPSESLWARRVSNLRPLACEAIPRHPENRPFRLYWSQIRLSVQMPYSAHFGPIGLGLGQRRSSLAPALSLGGLAVLVVPPNTLQGSSLRVRSMVAADRAPEATTYAGCYLSAYRRASAPACRHAGPRLSCPRASKSALQDPTCSVGGWHPQSAGR
jgi:hypothetical protein